MPRPAGPHRPRRWRALLPAVVVLVLAGCTGIPAPAPSTTAAPTDAAPVTFDFGTGSDPTGLDPALVSDGESYRVTRQILEGLVTVDPTTGAPAPSLATSWKAADDGLSYTFALRKGVLFTDGTAFNAAAVCTNFNRWFTLPKATRGDGASVTFKQVFQAFSDDAKNSIYKSCSVDTDLQVTLGLNLPLTGLLQALTLPAFAISSPAALSAGDANTLNRTVAGHKVSQYALHPVGTGPYTLTSWGNGAVTLHANTQYWGAKGQIDVLRFLTYDRSATRVQALLDGRIDGYDPVTPGDFDTLVKNGVQILQRDPFSVMYLGLNQAVKPLDDPLVRQAIAMAIDKTTLVSKYFIGGTIPATQFIPPKLSGFKNAVTDPAYNPQKAAELLKASSYTGQPLKFYYPTNTTRPYLPTPEKVYAEIARQLTAVGFNIQPVPVDWSDNYVGKVTSPGDHALDLMGWNGGYADPDNFISPIFAAANGQLGMTDPQLLSKITRARSLPNGPDRTAAYEAISRQIATTVPAVPIAYPISAVALSNRVASYPVSPVLDEVFNQVKLNKTP
ncbi:ABC transporter substrate-binding protein [Specibacter cremeus]|uniref:ABC transporter substrate-binding protein n=1 Tax=Specibacter cremeus TaxID=1629051 RepID=UPI001F0BC954|nr:ABC transporter substrate-binding protein [Specibacter cremeus]